MTNVRRAARELALRVLYQVDVGKQPLSAAIEGALDQALIVLENPLSQILRDAQAALKQQANRRAETLSQQSARQIRSAARQAMETLKQLSDTAMQEARAVLEAGSDLDHRTAELNVRAASSLAQQRLRQIASRENLMMDGLVFLVEAAGKKAQQMEQLAIRQLPAIAQLAHFALKLIHGVTEAQAQIDGRLSELATGWSLERQAAVDRNIMRLAAYEILFLSDVPTGASINEAVELAKKYSTAESGRFVNGVLGALAVRHENREIEAEQIS